MANKMTKREIINMMLNDEAVKSNEVFTAFLENELALIEKKASNKKPTQKHEANEELKVEILETVRKLGFGTVTQIQKASPVLETLSNQKVSSLIRQLCEAHELHRSTEKRTAIFSIAVDEDFEAED